MSKFAILISVLAIFAYHNAHAATSTATYEIIPHRSYIQEHKETIEVLGYEYPETKLDVHSETPKSQFDNGTLPEYQQGSFGKQYNLAPVKPYKVFLPTLQEEVTVTTTDPHKAAFELATQYRATDPVNFIGYRYISNEDLAVELARQTSSMYASRPSVLGIPEPVEYGPEESWWSSLWKGTSDFFEDVFNSKEKQSSMIETQLDTPTKSNNTTSPSAPYQTKIKQ